MFKKALFILLNVTMISIITGKTAYAVTCDIYTQPEEVVSAINFNDTHINSIIELVKYGEYTQIQRAKEINAENQACLQKLEDMRKN